MPPQPNAPLRGVFYRHAFHGEAEVYRHTEERERERERLGRKGKDLFSGALFLYLSKGGIRGPPLAKSCSDGSCLSVCGANSWVFWGFHRAASVPGGDTEREREKNLSLTLALSGVFCGGAPLLRLVSQSICVEGYSISRPSEVLGNRVTHTFRLKIRLQRNGAPDREEGGKHTGDRVCGFPPAKPRGVPQRGSRARTPGPVPHTVRSHSRQ